jgi:hypothetical protein
MDKLSTNVNRGKMLTNATELLLLPEKYLPTNVRDAKDIYENRSVLKQLLLSDYALNYLLDILLKEIDGGIRIRTLECLKVIKAIIRNNPLNHKIDDKTVCKLFYLYKTYAFHKSEEIRACANMLIRLQCLDSASIGWLISNWDKSEHIINRLLRYPEKHPLISEWAKGIYQQGQLPDRKSEVIALFIDESIPSFVKEDNAAIIWAIYYSQISDEIKQRLLMERFSIENLDTLWDVSVRLRYSTVIDFMRTRVFEQFKEGSQLFAPTDGAKSAPPLSSSVGRPLNSMSGSV